MNILQIIPGIDSEGTGIYPFARGFFFDLVKKNRKTKILLLDGDNYLEEIKDYVIKFGRIKFSFRFGFSFSLLLFLIKNQKYFDIIHNHGLWNMSNIAHSLVKKKSHQKIIISTHGTLSKEALNLSKIKKQIMWQIIQKKTLLKADLIHVTSYKEYNEVKEITKHDIPIAIIPLGLNIPESYKDYSHTKTIRRLTYIGRLTPIKGLENLLGVWKNIERKDLPWELVIAGADDRGYKKKLVNFIVSNKLKNVRLLPPVFGEDKEKLFLETDIFISPSISENFNFSVAEALSYGIPVITSQNTPWEGVEKYNCGWWIQMEHDSLQEQLIKILSTSQESLIEMGLNGRDYIIQNFNWNDFTSKMLVSYEWLLNNSEKPPWIK